MRKPIAVKFLAPMAKGHSYLRRKPGRRDEERRRFAELMRRVEKIRVREGLTKRALAAEIGASEDGLHSWISGHSIGRQETVTKIKDFLKRKEIERASGIVRGVIRWTEKSLRSRPSFTTAPAMETCSGSSKP
jgi:ribosome-binding protein aMBF1 (putative translation factor)